MKRKTLNLPSFLSIKALSSILAILGLVGSALVVFPLLQDSLGAAKQWWLIILVGAGLLVYLWQSILQQRFTYKSDLVSLSLGATVLMVGLGTLFAPAPLSALLGGQAGLLGFITFLALAVGFCLISNSQYVKIEYTFYWILISVATLVALWGLYDALTPLLGTPAIFLPFGSLQGLLAFCGIVLPLIAGNLVLRYLRLNWLGKVVSGVAVGAILLLAILVNLKAFWIAGTVGFLVLLVLAILHKTSQPAELLALGVIFLAFLGMVLGGSQLNLGIPTAVPAQIVPSYSASWHIASSTLSQRPLFGGGLSSFGNQYLLFRSVGLNQTPFWPIQFNQAASGFLTFLTETGSLGTGLLLIFLGLVISSAFSYGVKTWLWLLGLVYGITLWFVYPFSLPHYSLLFSLAALVVRWNPSKVVLVKKLRPEWKNLYYVSILFLAAIVVVGMFLVSVRAVSSYLIQQGRQTPQLDQKLELFERARTFYSFSAAPWRLISEVQRQQLVNLIQGQQNQQDSQQQKQQLDKIITLGNSSLDNALRAKQIDDSALNWEQVGLVYSSLTPIVPSAATQALNAYNQAWQKHPASPAYPVNLSQINLQLSRALAGQIQILRASKDSGVKDKIQQLQKARQQALDQALALIAQALQLKPDYAPAHFLLVQVRDERGELDQAIAQAERIVQAQVNNAGNWFQLGFLQFKKGDYQAAAKSFDKALEIKDDFGNARYLLGVAYNNLGKRDQALEQFKILKKDNPKNQEVAKIVENLEQGRPILEGIVPPAQPPQDRPAPPLQTGDQEQQRPGVGEASQE